MTGNSFVPERTAAAASARAAACSGGAAAEGADRVLDITGEVCPMTFVRTRLALDRLSPGQTLLVLLRGAEPRARVPATAIELGHTVIAVDEAADGVSRVLIRRT